jgi:hypothetical protein
VYDGKAIAEVVAEIKNKLVRPKATLQLITELKAGKRKRIPDEFIEDALKDIDKIVRLLNKLAGWRGAR